MLSATTKQLTLESVKAQFAHWRQTRDKMTRIPDLLWDKVFSLISHYPMGKVLSTLSINSLQLQKERAKRDSIPTHKPVESAFIEISNQAMTNNLPEKLLSDDTQVTLELKAGNGNTMTISKLPISHLKHVFSAFYGDR